MSTRAAKVGLATAIVLATGVLDYETGASFGFSIFYIAPVAFAGWKLGRAPALLLAALASICWIAADIPFRTRAEVPAAAWNGMTRLVIYFFVGESTARLRTTQEKLRALNEQLAQLLSVAESDSRTDSLTGLANRRAFLAHLESESQRARRRGGPLCLAYVDLDHFKFVNDSFGHARGDEVLRRMAGAIRGATRAADIPARIGGDEFAILLVDTDRDGAERVAHRILDSVSAVASEFAAVGLGASVGVVHAKHAPAEAQALIDAADRAMYAAKQRGGRAIVTRDMESPE